MTEPDRERQKALWDAIHDYVRACGGDPETSAYGNTARMDAVVLVEVEVRHHREAHARDQQRIRELSQKVDEYGERMVAAEEARSLATAKHHAGISTRNSLTAKVARLQGRLSEKDQRIAELEEGLGAIRKAEPARLRELLEEFANLAHGPIGPLGCRCFQCKSREVLGLEPLPRAALSSPTCEMVVGWDVAADGPLLNHLKGRIEQICRRLSEILGVEITPTNIDAWYRDEEDNP